MSYFYFFPSLSYKTRVAMFVSNKMIAVLIFLFCGILWANLQSGIIYSSHGEPVAYASVTDKSKINWTTSNANGFFNYNFSAEMGDTLVVNRVGYKEKYFILTESNFHYIELKPKIIPLPLVTVEKLKHPFDIPDKTVTLNSEFIPGVFPGLGWNNYGGRAGNQTFYFDGGKSVHTKILFENVSMTDPQNGGTDLTLIPQGLIHTGTLYSIPGVYFGSGVIDAAINLSGPSNKKNEVKISSGSFGYKLTQFTFSLMENPLKLSITAGRSKDDGNFLIDRSNGSIERRNNDMNQNYGMISSDLQINNHLQLYALLLTTITERGIAGSEAWLTPHARREDKHTIAKLSAIHLNNRGYFGLTLSGTKNIQLYDDKNPDWPIHSKHEPGNKVVKLNWVHRINPTVLTQTLYEYKNETITSTDVGNHTRSLHSFVTRGSWTPSKKLKFTPTLRYDHSIGLHKKLTNDLRATIQTGVNSNFQISAGNAYREPTINDLYWPDVGNSNLDPEYSHIKSLDWTKIFLNDNKLVIRFTDRKTKNLIQWNENEDGLWSPKNIASTQRTSLVISGEYRLNLLPFKLDWNINYQKTKDLNSGTPLSYIPSFQGFLNVKIPYKKILLKGLIYFYGKRSYTVTEYDEYWNSITVEKYMDPFIRFDLSANYNFPFLKNQFNIGIAVKNLLNEDTRTLPSYPNPLQNWTVSLIYVPRAHFLKK